MAIQTVKTGAAVNDGTGDDARTAFTKINQNFTDSANAASRLVGTKEGNVMEVGAFGLGDCPVYTSTDVDTYPFTTSAITPMGTLLNAPEGVTSRRSLFETAGNTSYARHFFFNQGSGSFWFRYGLPTTSVGSASWIKVHTSKNTSVDGNGFIKAASPIVKLSADKIELNDEAKLQDITFEKLGVGDYLIKGSLGFAQEGWYIEMPKDANGNVLVAVVYEQLANNDISVKTYDYMLNKKGRIVPDLETPLDIPETRWIDLRLQALPQTDTQPFNTDETVATNAE